jgi:hypothetical protein
MIRKKPSLMEIAVVLIFGTICPFSTVSVFCSFLEIWPKPELLARDSERSSESNENHRRGTAMIFRFAKTPRRSKKYEKKKNPKKAEKCQNCRNAQKVKNMLEIC